MTKTEAYYAEWVLGPWGLLSSCRRGLTKAQVHYGEWFWVLRAYYLDNFWVCTYKDFSPYLESSDFGLVVFLKLVRFII
jgi:hypothetical protein